MLVDGLGMPHYNDPKKFGKLYIKFEIKFPLY